MPNAIRYEPWFLPLSVPIGLGPKRSEVRIEGDALLVKMGWAFRATVPLSAIVEAKPNNDRLFAVGVHGFRGRWLINGSAKGIVELNIDPPVPAHALGMPIRLRTLWVSVTDPDSLIASCS